jgi:hypothetical protein
VLEPERGAGDLVRDVVDAVRDLVARGILVPA